MNTGFRNVRHRRGVESFDGQTTVRRQDELSAYSLVLEGTAVCNAKCPGCFPQYSDLPDRFSDLQSTKEVISLYAAQGGNVLVFTARGEPLLDKRLPSFITHAKDVGIRYVELTSNGQLMNDEWATDLIKSGLDAIRFSVTGSDQGAYAHWQGYKSSFTLADVERNILKLVTLRTFHRSATPKIYVRYIYDGKKDNADAVAYLRKWVRLVDHVQFTLRLPVLRGEKAVQLKRPDDIPNLFSTGAGKAPCPAAPAVGGGIAVTSEGDACLCSSGLGEQELMVGNVLTQPFDEVVSAYAASMAELNRKMMSGRVEDLPVPCQSCFALVDGGSNCQDFDILLLMSVAEIVEQVRALRQEKPFTRLVVVGANDLSKMILLNGDVRDAVVAVFDPCATPPNNPFHPGVYFKGLPLRDHLEPEDMAGATFVVADVPALPFAVPDGIAPERIIRLSDALEMINAQTFMLPDVAGIYGMPGFSLHRQMQDNFYFWYLENAILNMPGAVTVSAENVEMVARLTTSVRIHAKVPVLVNTRNGDASPGTIKTVALDQLHYTMPNGTIIVWSEAERLRVNKSLMQRNLTGNFQISSFDDLTTRAKEWLAVGDTCIRM